MLPSTFTWLAHDEAERRRIQEAVELFREQGTLDDLGIGSVRDAFSTLLFPGTSVLHTRARYFLFIPWIYRRLEQAGVSSRDVAARARHSEVRLINSLLAGGETRGVIGEQARAQLKQLPSAAYWSGLGTLGFRLFSGTQSQYQRSFDTHRALGRNAPRVADDEEPVARGFVNWQPALDGLAAQCPDFLDSTTFALSEEEGSFIRELVLQHAKGSLLAYLCETRSSSPAGQLWLHPRLGSAPAEIRRQVELARAFSALMHGASVLYNLLLSEKRGFGDLADELSGQFTVWVTGLEAELTTFEWDEFWTIAARGNPGIHTPTRTFVEAWTARVLELGVEALSDLPARRLVERREQQTKHAQARLGNPRRLETWTEPVGMRPLDYRWSVVREIVNDIARAGSGGRARG